MTILCELKNARERSRLRTSRPAFTARGQSSSALEPLPQKHVGQRRPYRRGKDKAMHEIIYLIGLVIVVMFVLGLVGLR